ncbi:uncharacterized protein LOC135689636 [Rhopilema esculentum]|uniref:uncharacterized protein LOC135689636 n=1 Tax=Rhopilema esculentum TaxID=499914 RepID=UPI0031E3F516
MASPSATPFGSLQNRAEFHSNTCCLCQEIIKKSEKIQIIKEKGLDSIKEKALQWKDVTNPRQYAVKFPYVYDELMRYLDSDDSTVLKCHTQCRKYFGDQKKLEANLKDSVLAENESMSKSFDEMTKTSASTSAASIPITRSKVVPLPSPSDHERKCFVCNRKRKKYRGREESLLKLQETRAEATLLGVMDANENSDDPVLHSAAKRLRIHQAAGDLLARELEYHKSCYALFTVRPTNPQSNVPLDTINGQCAEKEFLEITEKKVIIGKCIFDIGEPQWKCIFEYSGRFGDRNRPKPRE